LRVAQGVGALLVLQQVDRARGVSHARAA